MRMAPKSIDPRDRRVPVGLPVEVELFYRFQGKFVRDASLTRTMEQFLIDRATVPSNIEALARAIAIRAKLLNVSVLHLIKVELEAEGYDEFLDLEKTAEALKVAWGVEDLTLESADSE